MTIRPNVPAPVRDLAERLEEAGYETWTVGGAVRDSFLGRGPREDWDLTTRASPAEMRRVFRRTVPLGPEHGTLGVFGRDNVMYEITTFRRDVATDGRRAVVAFADTLDEDLARRDFTVNAMAWHPMRQELRDPHGGLDDLRARVLRAVGSPADRFREDYLRVLRGLRFAGAMELTVEDRTWAGLVDAVPGLGRLSPERVRDELLKVMDAAWPSRTLLLYRCSGVLPAVLPELGPLEAGAFKAVDRTKARPGGEAALLRIAVLLLFGLAAAGRSGGAGRAAASNVLRRLRFSNAQRERLATVVGGASGPSAEVLASATARRRWVAQIGPERVGDVFRAWIAAHRAGQGGGVATDDLLRVVRAVRCDLRAGVPTSLAGLKLGGRDLIARGWSPGPEVGSVLRRLLEAVWEEPSRNEPATLHALAETMRACDSHADKPIDHPPSTAGAGGGPSSSSSSRGVSSSDALAGHGEPA